MASAGYQELPSASTTQTAHDCVPLSHPDRQIRVLDLIPVYSRDPNTAPALHGRLSVINLPTNQNYSAISYVWAQRDPGTSGRQNQLVILCDGHQHNVQLRRNCWSALWHVAKVRGSSPLPLWIDAVCIDQRNDEGRDVNVEKLQQIPLMRTVFSCAHTTYFWLGEAAKGTDKAMDYLSKSKLCTGTPSISDRFGAAFELLRYSRTLSLRRHSAWYPHRAGIEEIFNRPWIRRLWILQECLLSRRGIVMCGLKTIAWRDLICVLESLNRVRNHRVGYRFDHSFQPWFNLANISTWFAYPDRSLPGQEQQSHQTPEAFDLLESKIQGHVQCLDSAYTISRVIKFVFTFGLFAFGSTMIARHLSSWSWLIFTAGFCVLWWNYVSPTLEHNIVLERKGVLFNTPAIQSSIIEELRNRKVTYPKDIYYGTVGFLGHVSPNVEEDLYTLYRRLCTGLIEKTQNLDILTYANIYLGNNYPGDDFPSWVIRWDLGTSKIWGKILQCKLFFWRPRLFGSDGLLMKTVPFGCKYNAYVLSIILTTL
jgi:hypothetical protein